MKAGVAFSVTAGALALVAASYTFLSSSIPYVSVREAIARKGDTVHVVGTIERDTVRLRLESGTLEFALKDDKGDVIRVSYKGMKPANFDTAPTISVAGQAEGDVFRAEKIIVKCPSKYESEGGPHPTDS